jgi:hypothetical protein
VLFRFLVFEASDHACEVLKEGKVDHDTALSKSQMVSSSVGKRGFISIASLSFHPLNRSAALRV